MPMKSPAVNRAIASHRRALSVRSKASSVDGKRKRYSKIGFIILNEFIFLVFLTNSTDVFRI